MKHILITAASIVLVIVLSISFTDIKTSITGTATFDNNLDYQIKSFLGVQDVVFPPMVCTNIIEDDLNKVIKNPINKIHSFTSDNYKKIIFQQGRTKGTLEISVAQQPFLYQEKFYYMTLTTETQMINKIMIKNIFLLINIKDGYAFVKNARLVTPTSAIVFAKINGKYKCKGYPY